MKIYYGKAIYDKKEINASLSVLKSKSLTLIDGPLVKELEKKISKLFGKKYGLMVNSGSSANLLALASLNLKKGDEVITPTLTFSTTVAPIYQLGLTPHFIDVERNSFVAKIDQIKKAINKKTKAIMVPNLLGNVPNWKNIFQIAKKKNIKLIEDSADTIGYRVNNKNLGKYSDITTNSMYASHIITGAGFGGMVCFNDKKTYDRAKLLRGWGRSSAIFNESEGIKKRIQALRDINPEIAIRTSIIVGFPGETDSDFEQLMSMVEEVQFDRLGVFTYSEEEGTTAASDMKDDIPRHVKEERLDAVMMAQQSINLKKNKDLVGQIDKVIVDKSTKDGRAIARSYRDAPEIDNYVRIDGNYNEGEFLNVKYTEAFEYDLTAEVME